MALPTFNQLGRPTLELVANADNPIHIAEIRADLVSRFTLTVPDLGETLSSGEEKFYNRVRWVAWHLKQAGLLHSPSRAVFECTPEGEKFLHQHMGAIERKTLKLLAEKQQDQDAGAGVDQSESPAVGAQASELDEEADDTPDEQMEQAFNESRAKLVDDLLLRVRNDSYTGFEMLVLDLLRKMGYGEPEHTGKSGDGGIDGIINQDALGLEKVYVQAKRWANQVGEPEIRNFSGSLDPYGATKGVFITTSTFSGPARQTARTISAGNKFIRLVDGNELAQLMIRHGVGVVTEYTYEIKKLDENYFTDEG